MKPARKRLRVGQACGAVAAITLSIAVVPGPGPAVADDQPWMNASLSSDERADLLVPRMTLAEKADLMTGDPYPPGQELAYINYAIPRLGIPELRMADIGPSVRFAQSPTTAFPMGLSTAATWNLELGAKVGAVVRDEARRKRFNTVLGTNVDIPRSPWWSRFGESYGEDPLLSGRMAAGFVDGVQGQKDTIVNLKHYNVYSQETNRTRGSAFGAGESAVDLNQNMLLDERTLQEFYTRAWTSPVAEGLASVMCAYSKVNGTQACESAHLLQDVLRTQLGFKGFVLTDFGASRAHTESTIEAGTNMETGLEVAFGPHGAKLVEAVNEGRVSQALLNERVHQLLRTYFEYGIFDHPLPDTIQGIDVTKGGTLARQVEEQAITLLKNRRNALPLNKPKKTKSIAVVGEGATWAAQQCCAGAATNPAYTVTPLEGIRNAAPAGVKVTYARGSDAPMAADLYQGPDAIPSSVLSMPGDPSKQGVQAVYWNNTTFQEPNIGVRRDLRPAFDTGPIAWFAVHPEVIQPPAGSKAVSYSGQITAPTSGTYRFSLSGFGTGSLKFEGKPIVSFADKIAIDKYLSEPITLRAGQRYSYQLDYAATNSRDGLDPGLVRLGWVPPAGTFSPDVDEAVKMAKKSDVAVVVAGLYETEARDRGELDLPTEQDELIEAVAKANPHTIVVLQSGGPVLMPWLDKVEGVVQMYYGGEEQGNALADVLFGNVNPSGKLPISYPATETQPTEALGIEASVKHSEDADVKLTEGVNVGYRGYAAAGEQPLFPFGYGLSYTTYQYRNASTKVDHGTVSVTFTVKNTGKVAGAEVAQVYAGKLPTSVATPVRQLAGWARVDLQAGQSKQVTVRLACKSLAYWDTASSKWVRPAGNVDLSVGTSSADLRLGQKVTVPSGTCSEGSDLAMNASFSGASR